MLIYINGKKLLRILLRIIGLDGLKKMDEKKVVEEKMEII
jgi:hypothetical protein